MTDSQQSDSDRRVWCGWVGDRAMEWRLARNAGAAAAGELLQELHDAIREAHYRRDVSVDALAASAGLTPTATAQIVRWPR